MDKTKQTFLKSKRSFRKRLPAIQSRDRIDYKNMSLISQFINEQGKICDNPKTFIIILRLYLRYNHDYIMFGMYIKMECTYACLHAYRLKCYVCMLYTSIYM